MQGVFSQPTWDVERTTQLRVLWFDGVHTSVIAEKLGVTKGMVCGKARREKLPQRVPAPWSGPRAALAEERERKKRERAIARAARRPQRVHPFVQSKLAKAVERATATPVEDMAIPLEQRKTLLELTPSCCKWPVGDPAQEGFFFCGGVAEMSGPYCPAHARRAYA